MQHVYIDILKYFWQKIKRYPQYVALIIIGQVGGITDDMLAPYIYSLIISSAEQGTTQWETILIYLGIILASGLTLGNFWRIAGFTHTKLQTNIIAEIANECFAKLHTQSYSFFSNNFTGALVKKVNRFVSAYETINDRITWGLQTLSIRTGLVLIFMLITDWRIFSLFLGWLIIFSLGLSFYLKKHAKYESAVASQGTRVTAQLADSITNFLNVKLFSRFNFEEKRFKKETDSLKQKQRKSWFLGDWYFLAQTVYMVIGEIALLYLTLVLWRDGAISIGIVITIQIYITQVMYRVWDLSHVFKDITGNLSYAEEMMEILEMDSEIADAPDSKHLLVTDGAIHFNKVNYQYDNNENVFQDLEIKIAPQEKIALVGESGAGKSTLVKLILRLHDVTAGGILIDDQDLRHVTQESLRAQIAFVPQDPLMFHRSIKENIRYGNLKATDAEIIKAAKLAHCHEFINKLNKGYDTLVGERGIKLSGGERQRIAIARAILKNAPILILDEATSSLDSKSERLIQDALHELMQNKTVIAIAHRLSTIREMDRIIVLENGSILEEGTHDELIASDEHYAELWKLQSRSD